MTKRTGKAANLNETPPALDAIVDRVLTYRPPSSKGSKAKSKVGKKRKSTG